MSRSREPKHVSFWSGVVAVRMQHRVDVMVERAGNVDDAAAGPGVRISYGYAREIVESAKAAETTIEDMIANIRRIEMSKTALLEEARTAASWAIHDAGLPDMGNAALNLEYRAAVARAVDIAMVELIGTPSNAG